MNPQIDRTSSTKSQEDDDDAVNSLNELERGTFDENGSSDQVLGVDTSFPDDLSTIANDTLATIISEPRTPEKQKKSGDDDTQPETPPKQFYTKTRIIEPKRLEKEAFQRQRSVRLRCIMFLAGFLGLILLGAIAVMSMALHQIGNDTAAASATYVKKTHYGRGPNPFDFGNIGPSPNTSSPFNVNTTAEWIYWTILSAAPDFYSETDNENVFLQNRTIQHHVLEWMADDPLVETFSPRRIVQRFALGVLYWSLTGPDNKGSVRMGGWMTYTDECQWPLSRKSQNICDHTGSVVALYLEDMGFDGTLAPEIGLLSHLERVVMASNNIQGQLPTEIALLTALEQFNLTQNAFSGTIPTEIGLLGYLGKLFVV